MFLVCKIIKGIFFRVTLQSCTKRIGIRVILPSTCSTYHQVTDIFNTFLHTSNMVPVQSALEDELILSLIDLPYFSFSFLLFLSSGIYASDWFETSIWEEKIDQGTDWSIGRNESARQVAKGRVTWVLQLLTISCFSMPCFDFSASSSPILIVDTFISA